MEPISFSAANTIFAKDQPEYLPLPAYRDPSGEVVTCWRLSWRERVKILFTGRLWFATLTFNKPLQPMRPSVEWPVSLRPATIPCVPLPESVRVPDFATAANEDTKACR